MEEEELKELIGQLFNSNYPDISPAGGKIILSYTQKDWDIFI